jgi:hypothetical protein
MEAMLAWSTGGMILMGEDLPTRKEISSVVALSTKISQVTEE